MLGHNIPSRRQVISQLVEIVPEGKAQLKVDEYRLQRLLDSLLGVVATKMGCESSGRSHIFGKSKVIHREGQPAASFLGRCDDTHAAWPRS
jgi:hypothetical protein